MTENQVVDPEVGEENIFTTEDEYTPEFVILTSGSDDLVIPDIREFQEAYDCLAVKFTDGILYVLKRDPRRWVSAEQDIKSTVKSIK